MDYYDAVMAERPYHKAMSATGALALLRQESGNALDAELVQQFIDLLPTLDVEGDAQDRPTSLGSDAKLAPVPDTAPATGLSPEPTVKTNVFEDIARAHREIYALYEIAQAMGGSLGVSDTMALITSKLSNLVPFSCCALFLYDADDDVVRCRFASGTDAELLQQLSVPTGLGMTGWVARNRRALVNARPNADFEVAELKEPHTTSLQSALVCPLVLHDRFIGTLSVYHVDPSFYLDDHRRLLDRVSEQAAAVIGNSIVFEQTQEDSLTDPLTGLPNTRFMFMHLSRELARADRLESPIALMVMDLDNFKEINDNHGHRVGDRALCEVAKILRAGIRPYDLCVRYAGDEFIVVLSGCTAEEAEAKRTELQQVVGALEFEARPGKRLALGMSIGKAVFSERRRIVRGADGRGRQPHVSGQGRAETNADWQLPEGRHPARGGRAGGHDRPRRLGSLTARGESPAWHRDPLNQSRGRPEGGASRENTGSIRPIVDNAQRRPWRDASAVECSETFTTGC